MNQVAQAEEAAEEVAERTPEAAAEAPPVAGVPPTPPVEEAPNPPVEEVPTPAVEEAPAEPVGFFAGLPIKGFVKSRYIGRATDGASDHDLQAILLLDVGDRARHRVTAHVLGDLSIDLDGNTDEDGSYAFDSARDSIGTVAPLIYSAYADVNRIDHLAILRVGRQSLHETPEVSYFDGLRVETEELGSYRVQLGAYGGFPVHLYEDEDSLGSSLFDDPVDLLGGIYAAGHLWRGARARADVQYLEGHDGDDEFADTLTSLGLWQRLGRSVDLHARYTREGSEDRDILARGTFTQPEWDFRFQASYYELLLTRREALVGVDAYYPILKEYVPYREYRTLVSKGLGEHVNVDVGLTIRRLVDEDRESDYNHEFERYFVTVDLMDLLKEGSSISLTLQRWDNQGRSIDSQGLDVTWPIDVKTEVSVGTAHYLYKYDYYSDQERDDVQDYYLKFVRDHSQALRLSAEYRLEDDDSSDLYHELRCEVTCRF